MTDNGRKPMRDYRCAGCGRLLFRAILAPGTRIEIRCTKTACGHMQRIVATPEREEVILSSVVV